MILGTAAYMAPEQARAKVVDKRADIWSFGCVLFEMLTGARAFGGDDVAETLAAVVRAEPNWTQLPPGLSSSLVTYIKRCLHKDPKQRIPDIAAMRLALDGAFDTAASSSVAAAPLPARGTPVAWVAALAVAVAVIIALAIPAVRYLRETPPASPPETRTEVSTPVTSRPTDSALSPDGRQIVFVASSDGASRLWLRSLATTSAQPLTGTEGAFYPFWSPDSRSIGFFAGTALKRLDLGGGAPQTLASASRGRGGMWTADGFIVFSPSSGPLRRVSATGGQATSVTTLGPKIASHRFPVALPDGRRFLFYAQGEENAGGIFVGALDGSAPTRLVAAESAGMFLPSSLGPAEASREGGWLLWVRAGALVAQQLDVTKAVLAGEPVTLADAVAVESGGTNRSAISVAPTGLVAYRVGGSGRSQLTWVDRLGAMRGSVGEEDPAGISQPRLSPDGRRVAVSRTIQANADVWLIDGARTSRITFDAANDQWPVGSPDGTRIAFESNRETGDADLYQKLASGAGAEERLVTSKQLKAPSSWSSDGRFLLYRSVDLETNSDLWVVPMVGEHTPSVFLKTPFNELRGVFSPDGRWVAYQSNESGRDEIYVRPFVPPGSAGSTAAGSQWQVSTAGGFMPAWRHDGKELYYLNASRSMMAAPIAVAGATLEPGAPVVLFPTRILVGGADTGPAWQYDVAPDGRFLINTVLDEAAAPITLIQNWAPDAKQ